MAATAQNGDGLRADQAGAADDDDLHDLPPLSMTGDRMQVSIMQKLKERYLRPTRNRGTYTYFGAAEMRLRRLPGQPGRLRTPQTRTVRLAITPTRSCPAASTSRRRRRG